MNSRSGILGFATSAILSSSVIAQEQSPVTQTASHWLEANNCSALRTPGIAEPSELYHAYISEHCQTEKAEPAEARLVIGDVGIAYREFLKLDAH